MADGFGLDYSEFDELIHKFEQLGVSEEEIGNVVLDAVSEDARTIFASHVPRSSETKEHAADHVVVSGNRKSRRGNKYRLVGAAEKAGSRMNWEPYRYLFYIENGTSRMTAKPFIDKAVREIKSVIQPKMIQTMQDELRRRLGAE